MKTVDVRAQRSVLLFLGAVLVLMVSSAAYSAEVALIAPQSGATVSGDTTVSMSSESNVSWANLFIDGSYFASTPYSFSHASTSWSWDTVGYGDGSHTISVTAYSSANAVLGSASITVTVSNGSGGGGGWQVPQGATISSLTGSASAISGADTNPAHYGQYSGWGDGYPLIGGPLVNDWQAASFVRATQKSNVELNAYGTGSANANANNYFNYIASNNPGNYVNQLSSFHGGYSGSSWQAEADRIDGACPIANPTTAEVLQWAANKWGINPLLLYAIVTNESHWDQTGLGDNGLSSGLTQIADRDSSAAPDHAFPGFSGAGSMLARESSCFNVDFFAARLFAAYHGKTDYGAGDISQAIASWNSNSSVYVTNTYHDLSNRTWIGQAFYGSAVPY